MCWKRSLLAISMLGIVSPSYAAEGALTPGEAQAKSAEASKKRKNAPDFMKFAGGLFKVSVPEDDLSEPVPEGTRTEFEGRGYEVIKEDEVEIVVDESGQLYVDRLYQGVIPGIRNVANAEQFKRYADKSYVLWVGFQPMSVLHRVFWLLTDPNAPFEVNKVNDRVLEVYFPGAKVPNKNTIRAMVMNHFKGPISSVVGARVKGGVRYRIELKKAALYIPRFEPPFLFVDFERTDPEAISDQAPAASGAAAAPAASEPTASEPATTP